MASSVHLLLIGVVFFVLNYVYLSMHAASVAAFFERGEATTLALAFIALTIAELVVFVYVAK